MLRMRSRLSCGAPGVECATAGLSPKPANPPKPPSAPRPAVGVGDKGLVAALRGATPPLLYGTPGEKRDAAVAAAATLMT